MESPCIRMCTLSEKDMCLGCGRKLNEITSWVSYSEPKRIEITNNCKNRLSALEIQKSHLVRTKKSQINNN